MLTRIFTVFGSFCLYFQIYFYQSVTLTSLEPANIKHTDLKLSAILPPLPLKFWDCKHVTPAQASVFTYLFTLFLFFKTPQNLM